MGDRTSQSCSFEDVEVVTRFETLSLLVGNGSVSSDEVMTLREFGRRLGLAQRACCDAQRRGLRTITFGRSKYVLGEDVIAWFRRLAEEQESEGAVNQMKSTTKQAFVRHLRRAADGHE